MAERIQKTKQPQERESGDVQTLEAPVVDATETLDITDELLDEIDAVLEQDAEEFVRSYVQKGGQ